MPLRIGTELPSLEGATEWLNSQPDLEAYKGKPLLVHFWSVSCHVCHDNLPALEEWRQKYGPKGLQFLAVHMPRQDSDTNVDEVKRQVEEYKISECCAVDNQQSLRGSFENEFLPAYFLFDSEGKMKFRAAGLNGIKMLQSALDKMMGS